MSNYLFKIYEKLTIPREGFPSQNRPCLRTTAPHEKRRRNRKNDRRGAAVTERSPINSVLPSTRMAITWSGFTRISELLAGWNSSAVLPRKPVRDSRTRPACGPSTRGISRSFCAETSAHALSRDKSGSRRDQPRTDTNRKNQLRFRSGIFPSGSSQKLSAVLRIT